MKSKSLGTAGQTNNATTPTSPRPSDSKIPFLLMLEKNLAMKKSCIMFNQVLFQIFLPPTEPKVCLPVVFTIFGGNIRQIQSFPLGKSFQYLKTDIMFSLLHLISFRLQNHNYFLYTSIIIAENGSCFCGGHITLMNH